MEKFQLISVLLLLFVCGQSTADPMINKWVDKLKQMHFKCNCWGEKTMMKIHQKVEETCKECEGMPAMLDVFDTLTQFENDDDTEELVMDLASASSSPFKFGQNYQTMPTSNQWQTLWNLYQPYYASGTYPTYPASSYYRGKRALMNKPSAEEMQEFMGQVAMFKDMKKSMVSNMTCVLTKLGKLDKNLDINLSFFTDKMWTMMAPGEFDPEFKAKMNEVYNTCYELSQSIPQSVLDKKGPMMKQFGRQKCFFKCVHKMEKAVCVKKDLLKFTEMMYGKEAFAQREQFGLPADKYEAAMMKWAVKDAYMTSNQKFMNQFFFGIE